jgi:hypothetical protein
MAVWQLPTPATMGVAPVAPFRGFLQFFTWLVVLTILKHISPWEGIIPYTMENAKDV